MRGLMPHDSVFMTDSGKRKGVPVRSGLRAALALATVLTACMAAGGAGHAQTLTEAMVATYNTNPTLLGARANLRAALSGYIYMDGQPLPEAADAEDDG